MSQILHTYIGRINETEQEEIDAINNDLPFTKAKICDSVPLGETLTLPVTTLLNQLCHFSTLLGSQHLPNS